MVDLPVPAHTIQLKDTPLIQRIGPCHYFPPNLDSSAGKAIKLMLLVFGAEGRLSGV